MIRNASDNPFRPTDQDEIIHPAIERLCAVLEQRFRQIVAEADRVSEDDLLTVEEVAEKLRISTTHVYELIHNRELKVVNLAHQNGKVAQRGFYRVRQSQLRDFVRSRETNSIPADMKKTAAPRKKLKVRNYLEL